ncbi:hypothetical protein OSB04_002467 [Centaurea solstitialis]|uniref:Integrase catalytic domain-containing protein n=1 Tax=Centaurea solstitialis TaxID=347529 RepID=A0AA38U3J4_9ASTR|nr:hypothetical protein OSB04_002467 [Centaurea solstitialis]
MTGSKSVLSDYRDERESQSFFLEEKCKVKNKHKKVILTGARKADVYIINMNTSSDNVCFVSPCEKGNRLGLASSPSRFPPSAHLYVFSTWISLDLLMSNPLLERNTLRSDHGTEFKNSTLETFFDEKGIYQNFSSVRTPQQNGVAERRNRTLIEAARSMLSEANLATQFWAEDVNTACYTQNRSLIVKRFKKTAYELFRNRKPSIEHFHIFGCVCYILNNKDNLGNFDSKSDDGIFLGYSSISKTYRVFNKRRQTIEETIHVHFDELGPTFPHPHDNEEINQWADSFFQVPDSSIVDPNPQNLPNGFKETSPTTQTYVPAVIDTTPITQVAPKPYQPISRVKDMQHTLDKLDRYNLSEWNEIRSLLPKANKNYRSEVEEVIDGLITRIRRTTKIPDVLLQPSSALPKPPVKRSAGTSTRRYTPCVPRSGTSFRTTDLSMLDLSFPSGVTVCEGQVIKEPVHVLFIAGKDKKDKDAKEFVRAIRSILDKRIAEGETYLTIQVKEELTEKDQDLKLKESVLESTDSDHRSEDLLKTLRSYSRTISEVEELADDRNNMLHQPPALRWTKNHPIDQVLGNPSSGVKTRRQSGNVCLNVNFISENEPKEIDDAMRDPAWVSAMQEELVEFIRNNVWLLVRRPPNGSSETNLINTYELYVFQMDIKNAFLNGKLNEEVYVPQPPSFVDPNFPDHVYKLNKALYGLKQAPRAWYDTLSTFLLSKGFERGKIDSTLFLKKYPKHILLVQIYVDDIIFGSTNPKLCEKFELLMKTECKMSMMGELTYFLGVQIKQSKKGIFINQASRPDILYSTCLCARYQAEPKESHLTAVKRIFRYLKGTPNLGLWYAKDSGFDLTAYSDSDFAGCKIDRKSTTGGCQLLGGKLVSWTSRKQNSVSTSTAEAEYVAAGICCAQVMWMGNQLQNYDIQLSKIPIYCDNTSAIAIANNPVLHSKTKHIEVRYHFIRDHVMNGDVELHFIPTEYQLADLFTKPLDVTRFNRLISEVGIMTSASSASLDTQLNVEATSLPSESGSLPIIMQQHDMQFKANNLVGLFELPKGKEYLQPARDFMLSCPLKTAFTIDPKPNKKLLLQLWSTATVAQERSPKGIMQEVIKFQIHDEIITFGIGTLRNVLRTRVKSSTLLFPPRKNSTTSWNP